MSDPKLPPNTSWVNIEELRPTNLGSAGRKQRIPKLPSHVDEHVPRFDRFATYVARLTSKAWFFIFCLLVVLVWAPSYFIIGSIDTWQLIINTTTTIFTFLMVALLQNTQTRDTDAMQRKLNAVADGLADFMVEYAKNQENETTMSDLMEDVKELKAAVGIEEIESS